MRGRRWIGIAALATVVAAGTLALHAWYDVMGLPAKGVMMVITTPEDATVHYQDGRAMCLSGSSIRANTHSAMWIIDKGLPTLLLTFIAAAAIARWAFTPRAHPGNA